MKIYLLRHTHAVPEDFRLSDEVRYLSEAGRQAARRIARALFAEGVEVDSIVASPLVRAVQTAELVAEGLNFLQSVEATSALKPGAAPRVIGEEIVRRNQAVLIVGHAPGLSGLGAFLAGKSGFPDMRKGQVCVLDNHKPQWTMHPDTLTVTPLHLA